MAQSINTFKNLNTNTSVYAEDTKITNLKFVRGKLTAKCTGLTTGKKILNFDHACRVVGVAFNASYGKAAHAFNVYKGASATANLLATVRPIANNVKYQAALLYPSNSNIAAGGFLTVTVSGANWNVAPVGYLEIETIPV